MRIRSLREAVSSRVQNDSACPSSTGAPRATTPWAGSMATPGRIALVGSGEYLPVMHDVEAWLLEGRPDRYVQLRILEERKSAPFKDWADFIGRVGGVGNKSAVNFSKEGLTVNGKKYSAAAAAKAEAKSKQKEKDKTASHQGSDRKARSSADKNAAAPATTPTAAPGVAPAAAPAAPAPAASASKN